METGYVFPLLLCYPDPTLILRRVAGQAGVLWLHMRTAAPQSVIQTRPLETGWGWGWGEAQHQNAFYWSVRCKRVSCFRGGGGGGGGVESMPEEEWLSGAQPQRIHRGSLIGNLYFERNFMTNELEGGEEIL